MVYWEASGVTRRTLGEMMGDGRQAKPGMHRLLVYRCSWRGKIRICKRAYCNYAKVWCSITFCKDIAPAIRAEMPARRKSTIAFASVNLMVSFNSDLGF